MKKLLFFILIFTWVIAPANSAERDITAKVVIENLTDKALNSGVFIIDPLNKNIEVTSEEAFNITLPSKGKYLFRFKADDFVTYTLYPKRITKKHNTIIIRLEDREELMTKRSAAVPTNLNSHLNLTDEQIEQRIEAGKINFIISGIDSSIPEEYIKFKEKYGVGLVKENCAIDPLSFKRALENNQMIFDYLNKKYGTDWLNELSTKPLGIK